MARGPRVLKPCSPHTGSQRAIPHRCPPRCLLGEGRGGQDVADSAVPPTPLLGIGGPLGLPLGASCWATEALGLWGRWGEGGAGEEGPPGGATA